jgi:hypothetical protein
MSRWIGAVVVAALIVIIAWRLAVRGPRPATGDLPIPGERVPYVVEVLNGTGADGLARGVTRRLRHQGIDVVSFGSATVGGTDSTLVIVRRGDTAAGLVVRRALGLGRVTFAPDSTLLLDVTVLLGRDAIVLDRSP